MKKLLLVNLIVFLSFLSYSQDFYSKWDNGFKITSDDGNFKLKFGGRIMYDVAAWSATMHSDSLGNNLTENFNGTEFRRIRFFNSGQVYKNVKYKLQLDFAGGGVSIKDVYIEFVKLPVLGNIKVGHFKEPLRLEALTSSKYITLMERGLPIALSPERNVGFMLHRTFLDDKLSFQTGVFRNASSGNDKMANGNRNITSRITYLAMNEDDKLLHIGVGFSNRTNADETYASSTRAENHLGNKLIKVDLDDVSNTNILGTEMAFNIGSFSIQAEYLNTMINRSLDSLNNHTLTGYYTQLSYFITGEKREYKNSLAGFDRVKPNKNFGDGGVGAIELAARYSSLDFSDANGGKLSDITLGVNWHLNPCTRIMLNYVLGSAKDNQDVSDYEKENTFQCRIQIDF